MSGLSSFSFRCPFCHTVLTVDVSLMGTTGPCPQCEKPIRAPILPAHSHSHVKTPPVYEVTEEVDPESPELTESAKEEKIPKILPREVRKATFSDVTQANFPEPPAYKPERSGTQVVKERGPTEYQSPVAAIVRTLLPIFFTAAVFVLIYGIYEVIKKQNSSGSPSQKKESGREAGRPAGNSAGSTPDRNAKPMERHSSSPEAMDLLETFLKTKSLEERLPMMETTASVEELAQSVLAEKLPAFRNIYVHSQKSFPLEKVVDYFFGLEFVNPDGSADYQVMAVRSRLNIGLKVLADPILDLHGGRLKEFALEPSASLGKSFYAVVRALPACTDTRIPNREKKISLRLLRHEKSDDLVVAYASKSSEIAEILERGNYDLTYEKPALCVVLLRWNAEEKPDAPYLEAVDFKSIHWNP